MLKQNLFLIEGIYYDWQEERAICNPLSLFLTNSFMSKSEMKNNEDPQ